MARTSKTDSTSVGNAAHPKDGVEDPNFRTVDATPGPGDDPSDEIETLQPIPHETSHQEPAETKCSACGATLVSIMLVVASVRFGMHQGELRFAGSDDASRLVGCPLEGRIGAQLCGNCGRVSLYAKPDIG